MIRIMFLADSEHILCVAEGRQSVQYETCIKSYSAMLAPVNLSETQIDDLIDQIITSRRITRADQERFMSLLMSKASLTEHEQLQINRVFDALRSGRIRVVD